MEIRTRRDEWDDRITPSRLSILYSMQVAGKTDSSPTAAYVETTDHFGSVGKYGDREMFDYEISNFKSRIKRGEIFNNPMSKVIHEYESSQFFRSIEYYRWVRYNYQDFSWKHGLRLEGIYGADHYLGYPHFASTWTLDEPLVNEEHYRQLAVTQAYANIDTSAVQSLVTAGEFRESVDFIFSAGKRMLRIYRNLRRLKLKGLRREITHKELSKRYLEYRYALRPMISEINGYFQTLVSTSRSVRQTYRDCQKVIFSDETDEFVLLNNSYGKTYARESITVEFVARAGVLCSVDLDRLDRWGFTKGIDTAWELAPFSFIADWFFNIGQTIASFTPELGVNELASWCSVAKVVTREKRVTRFNVGQPFYTVVGGSGGTMDHVSYFCSPGFVRSTTTTYNRTPNPKRSLLPTWNIRLDGWKLLDIGLIIKQLAS